MNDNFMGSLVVVLTGITGVAILAVLVSKNSQTPQVVSSIFGGYSQAVSAAVSPVTGGGNSGFGNISLPAIQL